MQEVSNIYESCQDKDTNNRTTHRIDRCPCCDAVTAQSGWLGYLERSRPAFADRLRRAGTGNTAAGCGIPQTARIPSGRNHCPEKCD